MVYCGKPSRGCQMCRTRRIKCDETKPTCHQCQKSRRQCPGYKDDFEIIFRNMTQATEVRVRSDTLTKKIVSPILPGNGGRRRIIFIGGPDTKNHDKEEPSSFLPTPTLDLGENNLLFQAGSLTVPIEEQAPCFFIANFVRIPQDSSTRGSFDFLLPIIKTERPDSHISIAFRAVALAALANRPSSKSSGLMNRAICEYSKALKGISLALQNPAQQKSDATLASILLMGFFETITSERTNVMAWGSHIDGAVQLTKLRGRKQLRTKTGHALFLAVRSQMIIHCMSASKAPMIGTDWWVTDDGKDPQSIFIPKFLLGVAELRHEVGTVLPTSPRSPDYFQKILDLMKKAQAFEHEYQEWELSLPKARKPSTVAWVDNVPGGDLMTAEIYPGRVDMYEDLFMANTWNSIRVGRLFVSGLIVRCAAWICHPGDYRTTPEYATCARVCADVGVDILASIPYHLGCRLDSDGALVAGDLSGFSTGADDFTSPKALGGWFCIWPLFCLMSSDYTTDSQRTWIKGRMNLIADIMGLNQARVIGSFFKFRLPSMVVRRDMLGHAAPTAAQYAAWAVRGSEKAAPPTYIPVTTAAITKITAAAEKSRRGLANSSTTVTSESAEVYQKPTGRVG